ncbi:glycosyltransferase family 4 protein [Azorhizobium doebereinerae]|uniref:glycosyltransferase family 4 protein n=1 Tax=Azorhizobium doebereinerae TaxID=281091 RepID=UPI0004218F8E|nr:glycosyltransferase family 1 protein [Azorhizobium doebereinerae]
MNRRAQPHSIMIDGYNLGLEKGTGVATYARNLSYACRDLGLRTEILYGAPFGPGRSHLLREISFFDPFQPHSTWDGVVRDARRLIPRPFGAHAFEVPVTGNVIIESQRARLPHFDRIWNASDLFGTASTQFALSNGFMSVRDLPPVDIMHWTYPLPLTLPGAKNIYTLHDLVPLRLPYTTLDHKARYLRLNQKLVKTADHIVTVSETSRRDIIELLDCPPEKVTNTYQAAEIPDKYLTRSEDDVRNDIEGAFGLPYKGYFLFFGAIEPKKNVGRLIEAYLGSQIEAPLVLLGNTAWKAEQELRLINDATNQYVEQVGTRTFTRERVRRLDYAPFSLLTSVIRGAKATVFPSLYEGFGLPILESMLLGTPVITSDLGATAEIAGGAALLVDPYDTRSIALALRELDTNETLRADLVARGRVRAEFFSTARYAERVKALYERLA